ncbi:hypothetical protein [Herbidospora cretacea]|uniref:hypothetical protein n=1 Tax=Herbidospora cretacea TaxID=28444 RepID=UPI0012DBDED1|nr:hypothetical protein [Herbidospora cretacea]
MARTYPSILVDLLRFSWILHLEKPRAIKLVAFKNIVEASAVGVSFRFLNQRESDMSETNGGWAWHRSVGVRKRGCGPRSAAICPLYAGPPVLVDQAVEYLSALQADLTEIAWWSRVMWWSRWPMVS